MEVSYVKPLVQRRMTCVNLQEQKAKEKAAGAGHRGVKQSAGELRLQKGVHSDRVGGVTSSGIIYGRTGTPVI